MTLAFTFSNTSEAIVFDGELTTNSEAESVDLQTIFEDICRIAEKVDHANNAKMFSNLNAYM
ncbi:MAG: hypothetical protein QXN55_01295 [Candidatus Nitrosotenuis sp.]